MARNGQVQRSEYNVAYTAYCLVIVRGAHLVRAALQALQRGVRVVRKQNV